MTTGTIIKRLIKQRGFIQKDFASKIGISETSLSLILSGKTRPSEETLDRIAKELKVPVPVLSYLTLTEEQVATEKREAFKTLSPMMDQQILQLFDIDMAQLRSD